MRLMLRMLPVDGNYVRIEGTCTLVWMKCCMVMFPRERAYPAT